MKKPVLVFLAIGCFALFDVHVMAQSIGDFFEDLWAKDTRWENHTKWALNQLLSCRKKDDDKAACNRFVGQALELVYDVKDFKKQNGEYLRANGIIDYVLTHKTEWRELGHANDDQALKSAQSIANSGQPVIAAFPAQASGHVAIIIPGELTDSTTWKKKVPNSASMFLDKPEASYVGKPLSQAFKSDKKQDVKIYQRLGVGK